MWSLSDKLIEIQKWQGRGSQSKTKQLLDKE